MKNTQHLQYLQEKFTVYINKAARYNDQVKAAAANNDQREASRLLAAQEAAIEDADYFLACLHSEKQHLYPSSTNA